MYGNREVTQNDKNQLLKDTVTEETMAGNSSINSKLVYNLLLNVMAMGDLLDVVNFLKEIQEQCPLFCFPEKKQKKVDPEELCGVQQK